MQSLVVLCAYCWLTFLLDRELSVGITSPGMRDLKHKCLSSCITRCPLRLFCVSLLWAYFMSHFSGLMRYHSVLSSWHIFSNTCRLIHLLSILIFPFSKPPPPFILLLFIYSFCNSILTLVIYTFTEALINILKCGVCVVDVSMVVFCPHLVVVGIDRNYTILEPI